MSVPLPAPDGPVTTNTGALAIEEGNQLVPLAVGEAADRLRLADAAGVEQACSLYTTELRDRHQHVEHLRGRDIFGRLRENLLDRDGSRLEVLLELGALHPDVVRALEG